MGVWAQRRGLRHCCRAGELAPCWPAGKGGESVRGAGRPEPVITGSLRHQDRGPAGSDAAP